jgi:hypothetical protein
MAGRLGFLRGTGPVDPDPGANTSDRYQTWHQLTLTTQVGCSKAASE